MVLCKTAAHIIAFLPLLIERVPGRYLVPETNIIRKHVFVRSASKHRRPSDLDRRHCAGECQCKFDMQSNRKSETKHKLEERRRFQDFDQQNVFR